MGAIPEQLHVLPRASWPSESIGAGSTLHGDRGQWLPRQHGQRHWHRAIQSNATGAKGKHAGRELQGKASTAPAYGCGLASWMFGQRRSVANLIPTFGFQRWGVPRRWGTALPNLQQGLSTTWMWLVAENGHDLSPFVLCISLTYCNVANPLWKKTTTQQLAPPFTLPHFLEEQLMFLAAINTHKAKRTKVQF